VDGERGAYEVWARVVWAAIDVAEQGGLRTDALYEGLPFDARSVRRLRHVDWIDYCVIVERIETLAGGPEGCERLLSESYHDAIPELRAVARAFVGPKALMRLVTEVITPIMFPALEFRFEDLRGDRARVSCSCRPRARACLPFFAATRGGMRGLPQHLGLPPAEILDSVVTPERGSYEFRLPPSQTIAARVRRSARARKSGALVRLVLGYDDDGAPLGAAFGSPDAATAGAERLQAAMARWSLTPRQVDVLELLSRGDSNKEIAQQLSCAENTVELHVTQLLRKAGASSRAQLVARFWSGL